MRLVYLLLFIFCIGIMSAYAVDNANIGDERRLASFCNTCHGNDGFSVGKSISTIMGQNKQFLINSMDEFKSGKRHFTLMGKIATGYNEKETEIVATWFSAMKWKASNSEKLNSKLVASGKKLATTSDCASCHNSKSESYIPKIDGQHSAYLFKALQEYKAKKRNNEAHAGEMDIVVEMKDDDLKALAEYFASLK